MLVIGIGSFVCVVDYVIMLGNVRIIMLVIVLGVFCRSLCYCVLLFWFLCFIG